MTCLGDPRIVVGRPGQDAKVEKLVAAQKPDVLERLDELATNKRQLILHRNLKCQEHVATIGRCQAQKAAARLFRVATCSVVLKH